MKLKTLLLTTPSSVVSHILSREKEFLTLLKQGKTVFDFSPYLNITLPSDILSEACFCILTANFKADKSILIQKELGIKGCHKASPTKLEKILKKYKHRFVKQRVERIIKLRENVKPLTNLLNNYIFTRSNNIESIRKLRSKLIKHIDGFGLKEASHFLRNIGILNVGIIDRHILRFLKNTLNWRPKTKTLTKNTYYEAENLLLSLRKYETKDKKLSHILKTPGLSDLLIFFWQTGEVLK